MCSPLLTDCPQVPGHHPTSAECGILFRNFTREQFGGWKCRAVMNNSSPRSKVGLIDLELNGITKLLFLATVALSFVMVCLKGFDGPWYIYIFRFILLFSYLIPISLRVNLDMGKIYYSFMVQRDKQIPGTVARSTTIPEELGRIQYLLSGRFTATAKYFWTF